MHILIIGLAVFVVGHVVPMTPLKPLLKELLGSGGYGAFFGVTSLIAFALIIWGFLSAEFIAVYEPPLWGRYATMVLVFCAIIILVSMLRPCHIRKYMRFPGAVGLLCWAGGHLLANGDLASVIMFGTFAVYCVVSFLWGYATQPAPDFTPLVKEDCYVIATAILIYLLIFTAHPYIIGAEIIP